MFFWLIFIGILLINPRDKRRSDVVKRLVFGGILLSIISGLFPGLSALALIALGIYAIRKGKIKKENLEKAKNMGQSKTQQKEYSTQWKQQQEPKYNQYQKEREISRKQREEEKTTLPPTAKKRSRILELFNTKYNLYLTDDQQDSIVNASYLSKMWRIELEDMSEKYNSVYEWIKGPTAWLRAYLYAFHVQEVSSDFMLQENIVIHAYESIFNYASSLNGLSLSETIRAVNEKFFTSFDDTCFMIAYRYMESRGYTYELPMGSVVRSDDTVDDLLEKYAPLEQPSN